MLAVVGVLLLVVGVLWGTVRSNGADAQTVAGSTTTTTNAAHSTAAGALAPVPTVLSVDQRQPGTTSPYETTTVWVTTTTTTTTIPGLGTGLNVRGGPLAIAPGGRGTLLVSNTGAASFQWGVASSDAGVRVTPARGELAPHETATLSVRVASDEESPAATLTFVTIGGGVATVSVRILGNEPPATTSLSFSPASPTCGQAVVVTAVVPAGAVSVLATYRIGDGVPRTLVFTKQAKGTWTASIPAQSVGAHVQVAVRSDGSVSFDPLLESYDVGSNGTVPC